MRARPDGAGAQPARRAGSRHRRRARSRPARRRRWRPGLAPLGFRPGTRRRPVADRPAAGRLHRHRRRTRTVAPPGPAAAVPRRGRLRRARSGPKPAGPFDRARARPAVRLGGRGMAASRPGRIDRGAGDRGDLDGGRPFVRRTALAAFGKGTVMQLNQLKPPPGPFRPGFWRSPIRGPWLTSVLGLVLLVALTLVFLTGL